VSYNIATAKTKDEKYCRGSRSDNGNDDQNISPVVRGWQRHLLKILRPLETTGLWARLFGNARVQSSRPCGISATPAVTDLLFDKEQTSILSDHVDLWPKAFYSKAEIMPWANVSARGEKKGSKQGETSIFEKITRRACVFRSYTSPLSATTPLSVVAMLGRTRDFVRKRAKRSQKEVDQSKTNNRWTVHLSPSRQHGITKAKREIPAWFE
jgi:hypothetical protein